MRGLGLSFDCVEVADEGLVAGESCTRFSGVDANLVLLSYDMSVGLVVGVDVLVAALCLRYLWSRLASL